MVTTLAELAPSAIENLFARAGLGVAWIADTADIPGSYWGAPEAGLRGNTLFVRADTPVHSALHEAAHFFCMDAARRAQLDRDAGGSDTEEHAVCYLQCLLADRVPGYSRERVFADMDAWGYHFILGSAGAWFAHDADDAQRWLHAQRTLERLAPLFGTAPVIDAGATAASGRDG